MTATEQPPVEEPARDLVAELRTKIANALARDGADPRWTSVVVTAGDLAALLDEGEHLAAELARVDNMKANEYVEQHTGVRSMRMEGGRWQMDVQPGRELVARWCAAARAMLGDAENYSETPISMPVPPAGDEPLPGYHTGGESGRYDGREAASMAVRSADETAATGRWEEFIFRLERADRPSPHQLRRVAERHLGAAIRTLRTLRDIHSRVNMDTAEDTALQTEALTAVDNMLATLPDPDTLPGPETA